MSEITNEQSFERWKSCIKKAIQFLDDNGWNARNNSTGYNVEYNGKYYPPKRVYAEAIQFIRKEYPKEYIPSLTGGEKTNDFLRQFKFIVRSKDEKTMINKELYDLKDSFLREWPIQRLESMRLEEYTNLDKTSFCYWVEQKTESIGGIRGGSSYKFGIYRMAESSETEPAQNRTNNGEYAWHLKYGANQTEAFNSIKKNIIQTAKLSQGKQLRDIDDIDLGDAYKWKIAFLYSNFNVINIFNKASLTRVSIGLELDLYDHYTISQINSQIVGKKPDNEDFFTFSSRIWNSFGNESDKAKAFKKWLKENQNFKSGKVTSYLRAISILKNHFKIRIYEESDLDILNNLYNDLIEHQKKPNGKYFYKIAPSYGNSGYYSAAIRSYLDYLNANLTKDLVQNEITKTTMKPNILNTILFGPPGTGKTYNTINEALKIVDPEFYKVNKDNREALNRRFKELLIKKWDETKGQIAFCTFHQSFGYEDFVEGIKPKVNEKNDVYYKIENGIFKNICELADSNLSILKVKNEGKLSWDESEFRRASFYKLSLGNSQISEDFEIYEYCRDYNYISVGFGDDMDFSGLSETQIKEKFEDENYKDSSAQMLNYFIHYLKKDNYVLISNGNQYVRALGKVVGDYEYIPNAPIRYNHFRKVEWIFVDENIPIEEIYEVGLSQRTIYKIDENKLKPEFFIDQGQMISEVMSSKKNYVLIIDEINRGNVSSIFGELITLIELDKRAGSEEELEVILPYSKLPFKVPHNVHIIGTMNTADKSIEALDTALRRRFSFVEMAPNSKLIEKESLSGEVNGVVDGVELKTLLDKINNRIEKLIDKDHKIGHSYFLKVNDKSSLIHCFKNEVIPLLEEYFFGDYGKIGLILGNSFIAKDEIEGFDFSDFEGYDSDIASDLRERPVFKISKSKNWDFKSI